MNKLKLLFPILTSIIAGLLVAIITFAWTNPTANPPSGGGALYYYNGNVGIGTTTPVGELEISSTGQSDIFINSAANNNANLWFQQGGSNTFAIEAQGGTGGSNSFLSNRVDGGGIIFRTTATTLQERMAIISNGNVGIGTSAPGLLDNVDSRVLELGLGGKARTIFRITKGSDTYILGMDDVDGKLRIVNANGLTNFMPRDSAKGIIIDQSGNVGIGTVGPAARLTVQITAGDPTITNNVMELNSGTKWWRMGMQTDASAGSLLFSGSDNTTGWKVAYRFEHNGNAFADGTWNGGGADYAEWFKKEENIPRKSLVGLNVKTGYARVWRKGDPFLGVQSTTPGFIGNNIKGTDSRPEKMEKDYVLVALMGQVEIESNDITEEGRMIKTTDGQFIGWRLEDGRIFIR